MSKGSSDPEQTCQSSGSRSNQGRPLVFGAKPSCRGGLASVVRLVKLGRCKNVVVVAGAGISTASGIPDFRLVFVRLTLLISTFSQFLFLVSLTT